MGLASFPLKKDCFVKVIFCVVVVIGGGRIVVEPLPGRGGGGGGGRTIHRWPATKGE